MSSGRSKLNTFGQLHALLTPLITIANSLADPSPTLRLSGGVRRSNSAESFLKSMIDQKLNKSQRNFKQSLGSLKLKLPMNTLSLSKDINQLIEESIDQSSLDLMELDIEAAKSFSAIHCKRLRKVLQAEAEAISESNLAAIENESSVLTSTFLSKIKPKRVTCIADIDPEMFLRMKDFFCEFMKYFEDQCKDPIGCKTILFRQSVFEQSAAIDSGMD